MNKLINLYFEKGGEPSIVLTKNSSGGIDTSKTPGFTRSLTEEEEAMLASSIRTLLGQKESISPIKRV